MSAVRCPASRLQTQRMPQQHRCSQHRRQGIGNPLPGDVRGTAVNWLVQSRPRFAQRCRRKQAQRSRQHRTFVGQDVSEHVAGDDHVEVGGTADQVHRHRVDQDHVIFEIRVLLPDDPFGHLPPQPRHLQHVGLVNAGQLSAPPAGRLGCQSHHPFNLVLLVDHFAEGRFSAGTLTPSRLSEVNASGQFTDEQDVDPFDDLSLQRRCVDQLRMG